jgi:hypothetical protein
LETLYEAKRLRTTALVIQSVDALVEQRRADKGTTRISLASIVARSKKLDPSGKGISQSAILGNEEARSYYERHRTSSGNKPKRQRSGHVVQGAQPVKIDRDMARARHRYMRMSKPELVERLLAIEQAYTEGQDRWLKANDELFERTMRVRQGEVGLPKHA